MDLNQFLDEVAQQADLPSTEHSERAVRATLETLAERIIGDEAHDLASQLPAELGDALQGGAEAERFGVEEFLGRVATRGELDPSTAQRAAQAVFSVTRTAVTAEEFDDVVAQLPTEYEPLLLTAGGMPDRRGTRRSPPP